MFAAVRAMHPADIGSSAERLRLFLIAWWGGPLHYQARFGHPRLRAAHLRFPIDTEARDAWLACMEQALIACGLADDLRAALLRDFTAVAEHIRNHDP
jgi:hemoglobin